MSESYPLALPLTVTFSRDDDAPDTVWATTYIDGEPINSGASDALVAINVADPDHISLELSQALAFMPATFEPAIAAAYAVWHRADDPHCTCNTCLASLDRPTLDETPAWWAPRIEFLGETDPDAVAHVLQILNDSYVLRLTTTNGLVCDVSVVSWDHRIGPKQYGALVRRNEDAEPVGEPYAVPYDEIAAIGIY